jgi:hypothetical protein
MDTSDLLKPVVVEEAPRLSVQELEKVEKLLGDDKKFGHIHHTLQNMIRIPYQFIVYNNLSTVKVAQLGLNIGRAQELLEDVGGIEYWWRHFKKAIEKEDWELMVKLAIDRFIEIMGSLDLLDTEEINRQ